jgi:hypothetical protein
MIDYKRDYAQEKSDWIAKEIALYEETTGITLDPHNRATLRRLKAQEFGHWEHWEVRKDNIRGADDQ